MNFIARTKKEYISTVIAIFESAIFKETILNNIFEVEEETIKKEPEKYPVFVNIEIEEWAEDNKCFTFNGISFIYMEEIMTGIDYQEKLIELRSFDAEEGSLIDIINTSGIIDKPIARLKYVETEIKLLEKLLF